MHHSMRRERRLFQQRAQRDEHRAKARVTALNHLRRGISIRATIKKIKSEDASLSSYISHGIVGNLRKAMSQNDEHQLAKLLNPQDNRASRTHVLSRAEQEMISATALHDSTNGNAWTALDMRIVMGKVAQDGRANSFKSDFPVASTFRRFRAQHSELTFRNKSNKEFSKVQGEQYEHVKTLHAVLEKIFKTHSDIKDDPDRIWNMDETAVNVEFGIKEKVLSSSRSNMPGSQLCGDKSGGGAHVTCVVAVSASGLICPPFFIIQGKHSMTAWTEPLDGKAGNILKQTTMERFTRENWFPKNGVKMLTEKGSMTMDIMPIFIRHFNTFARKHVPIEKSLLLTLDGHASRKGVSWLEEALHCNIEVAKTPANTSHRLQPCDQKVNKTIKSGIRLVRDRLVAAGMGNVRSVQFKLVCALQAIDDLSVNNIRTSFSDIGLWPMDFRFLKTFKKAKDRIEEEIDRDGENVRVPDSRTAECCLEILSNRNVPPEKQLQQLQTLLRNRETVNSIVMEQKRSTSERSARSANVEGKIGSLEVTPKKQIQRRRSHRMPDGCAMISPARHLTHGESMLKLNAELAKRDEQEAAKARRRQQKARVKAMVRSGEEGGRKRRKTGISDDRKKQAVSEEENSPECGSDHGSKGRAGELQDIE